VATALPQIVSHFDALNDVSWPAHFLTQGGLILFVGQVLRLFPKKAVYLSCVVLFEVGSLICAVANSMPLFIAGRAVAGCGAAGIQMSVATLTPEITPLDKRPVLYATFGGVLGLSAVLGPLLGGAFTGKFLLWCFWINLPVRALRPPYLLTNIIGNIQAPLFGFLDSTYVSLDWVGAALMLGSFASFLLPLQWGGNVKSWSDPTVIALFVVSAALLVVFLAWERFMGPKSMVPLGLLARRTQVGGAVAGVCLLKVLQTKYYLPLWYQARGQTAIQSGLSILPYLISLVIAAGVAGATVTKFGNYWWFLFLFPVTTAVAGGLLFTLRANTPAAHLIGFQILYGIGIGTTFQNVLLAVQVDFADNEDMIPQATAFVSFTQILGGIVGISQVIFAGSIFANKFRYYLDVYASDLPPDARAAVLQTVTVIKLLPPALKAQVVEAYARGLGPIFLLSVAAAILSSLSTLCVLLNSSVSPSADVYLAA
ncbi:hypothetical protein K438DRAFT_1558838, partial [Mycena galopus ATCC 62051]